jgi:hypothetical protein
MLIENMMVLKLRFHAMVMYWAAYYDELIVS